MREEGRGSRDTVTRKCRRCKKAGRHVERARKGDRKAGRTGRKETDSCR